MEIKAQKSTVEAEFKHEMSVAESNRHFATLLGVKGIFPYNGASEPSVYISCHVRLPDGEVNDNFWVVVPRSFMKDNKQAQAVCDYFGYTMSVADKDAGVTYIDLVKTISKADWPVDKDGKQQIEVREGTDRQGRLRWWSTFKCPISMDELTSGTRY